MSPEKKFNSRPRRRQMAEICFQKAPGQDLAKNGRFPMIPDEKFNSRPRGRQMAESCFQKAPGQDLAKNGQWHWRPSCFKLKWEGAGSKLGSKLSSWRPSRFKLKWEVAGSKLGSKLSSWRPSRFKLKWKGAGPKFGSKLSSWRPSPMAEMCFQKAPGQDLAKNGRFPMIPDEKFNSRPRAAKWQRVASKRLPARIWSKTANGTGDRPASNWNEKGHGQN